MLHATDSLLKYLNATLAGNPPVSWYRVSSQSAATYVYSTGLNVSILGIFRVGSTEEVLVSLDVIGDDERMVLAWIEDIQDALSSHGYITEYDYSLPSAPVETGYCVSWECHRVRFDVVGADEHSVHYNATFPITHVRAFVP